MAFKRRYRPRKKGNRRYGNRRKYVPRNKKYGITKSLNYKGFHSFKESRVQIYYVNPDSNGNGMLTNLDAAQPAANAGFSQGTPRWNPASATTGILQWDHYKSLWNRYQITGIKWKIFPTRNTFFQDSTTTPGQGFSTGPQPTLLHKIIPNRTRNPATVTEFMNMDPKVRLMNGNRPLTVFWKSPPAVDIVQADSTGTVADSANQRGKWFNAQDTVNVYAGMLGLINLQPAAAGFQPEYKFKVIETIYWNMKTQV